MHRSPHVFTSIPPRIHRRDSEGNDIGRQYQSGCIASWVQAGFTPLSVNSIGETEALEWPSETVRFCTVGRDAQHITGRPHVYLHDLLQAAIKNGGEQIAIVNSDILLEPAFDLAGAVRALKPGHAIVAKRVDVTNVQELTGKHYPYGFDFFAMHIRDARCIEDIALIYGMPWWDYYVISALCLSGIQIELVQEPFAFHLVHEDRWDWKAWNQIGTLYADYLRDKLVRLEPTTNGNPDRYAEKLREVLSRKPTLARRLRQRGWPGKNHQLYELSRAVISFMDQTFACHKPEFVNLGH